MDFHRLFDLLAYQAARYPNAQALNWRHKGRWESFSIVDCQEMADRASAAFLRAGISRGDHVAMISRGGSPHWMFADAGLQQIGAVAVPIHAAILPEELAYILEHAGVKACLAGELKSYQLLEQLQPGLPSLQYIWMTGPDETLPSIAGLSTELSPEERMQVRALAEQVSTHDLATIIYTSGTTGMPKGVMLSHFNMVSNIKSIIALMPINSEKRVLSYLPITHIFERMVVYTYVAAGASVYFAESTERLWMNLQEIKPHYFTAVPLVLDRFYRYLRQEMQKTGAVQRRIADWALSVAENYRETGNSLVSAFRLKMADLLVFRRWRKALGGNLEGIVAGAAALAPELGRVFSAAGIAVREGYGLTETSPVVSFNRFEPGGVRFGTVGIPVPGVEVRILDPNPEGDGEILVRGPNVMLGYYRDEAATRRVIDAEGWLHTGDIGRITHKRFLQISGRLNEAFKTSAGKFIVPQTLERLIKASPYIDQVVVLGANQPYLAALVVPDFNCLELWCQENGVHWTAPAYMVHNLKVRRLFEEEFGLLNARLPAFEQIKAFDLLPEPWNEASGELTPTMKIRRRFIAEKYQREIEALFVKEK